MDIIIIELHVCQSECFTYLRGRGHIKLCFIIMHCIQLAVYIYTCIASLVPRPFSYVHAREGKEGSGK